MEQRRTGRSGLTVSELGLGTMTWGQSTDADEAASILRAFRDAGGTLVDTAASYGNGAGESMLGSLLHDVVPRDELVIATKAGLIRGPDGHRVDASRGALLRALDTSLTTLGVEHVDLWQIHTPDPQVPVEETLSALDHAVTSGKAHYVGLSNYCGWRLAQAATWQRAVPGRAPIASDQVGYSLLSRGVEREVLPACLELGVGLLPYSPLGGGVLTGKYRESVPADSRGATLGRVLADYTDARQIGIVEAVATAADGLGCSPLAVALSWIRERPGVTAPIIGARTRGQLTALVQAMTVRLPAAIRDVLDEVSAPDLGYPEDVH